MERELERILGRCLHRNQKNLIPTSNRRKEVNFNNLIKVSVNNVNTETASCLPHKYFVPSVLLSNIMSLAPKIAEIAVPPRL